MSYELRFPPDAKREWDKLDSSIRGQFKIRAIGYRLIYQVNDNEITVLILSVGKRENSAAYTASTARQDK